MKAGREKNPRASVFRMLVREFFNYPLEEMLEEYRETIEQIGRKKIYLGKQALTNLRNLKRQRLSLGLSRKKTAYQLGISSDEVLRKYECGHRIPTLELYFTMAEYFHWHIQDDPNYIFIVMLKKGTVKIWLKKQKKRYNYTFHELAQKTGYSEAILKRAVYRAKNAGIQVFGALYELFTYEKQQERYRQELLR